MIFGRTPSVPTARPRGDTDRLPIELDISTSPLSAVPKIVIGAVFAGLGYNLLGGFDQQGEFGSVVGLAFQAAPVVIMLAGVGVFARGVIGLADNRTARIGNGQVTVTGRSLLRSENWSEPLDAYDGVRWREVVVYPRRGASGNLTSRVRPRVYQVLDLKHPDPARCIPLYVTRLSEDARPKLERLGMVPDLKDGTRPKWEHFAKLLDLPAIDARGGETLVRAAGDVDKSIKELAVEGKIPADWDDRSAPPAGLEVAHDGSEADPGSQAILVTLRAKRFPLWLYGGVLVFGGFLPVLGVVDLALIPILFGGGLSAGVAWHWKYEERHPRTVRITRSSVELDTPNPGNPAAHSVIRHGDIESVQIIKRQDRNVIGRQLAILTDHGEHRTGAGLSDEALKWLRDLIVSAVARA